MPTSLKVTPVSFHNGQKRINLRAALETQQYKTSSVEMTFGELARAYLAVHYNGADMQLRKWIDLLDSRRAWDVGVEELGWIPPPEGFAPDLIERQPWLKKHQGGKSVTELEILHGVLKRSTRRMCTRRIF